MLAAALLPLLTRKPGVPRVARDRWAHLRPPGRAPAR